METSQESRNRGTLQRLLEIAAAREWDRLGEVMVEDYRQHNPEGKDGLEATKQHLSQMEPLDNQVYRVIAEGDLVAIHSHFKGWNAAAVDIFRFNDDGKIIEHWDVIQPVPDVTASGNDMFSQLSKP
jgi:predicted SnoaL-like aldol condensation-catalyzing enzyme